MQKKLIKNLKKTSVIALREIQFATKTPLVSALWAIVVLFFFACDQPEAQTSLSAEPLRAAVSIVPNQGHPYAAQAADISKDGRYLATVAFDETAKLWDMETGRLIRSFVTKGNVHLSFVALSPDGKQLAVLQNTSFKEVKHGEAWIFDIDSGGIVAELEHFEGEVDWLTWSPDGRWLAAGGRKDGIEGSGDVLGVAAVDTSTWETARRQLFEASSHTYAKFSRDSTHLIILHKNKDADFFEKTVTFWDVDSETAVLSFTVKGTDNLSGETIAVAPKQDLIAVMNAETIDLYNFEGHLVRTTAKHSGYLAKVFFALDGKSVYGLDGKRLLHRWDVATGRKIPPGKAAVSEQLYGVVAMLHGDDHSQLIHLGSPIRALDLETFATARVIGTDIDSVSSVASFQTPNQVIAGGGAALSVVDILEGRQSGWIPPGDEAVWTAKPSQDGQRLFIGYNERLMRMLEAGTWREVSVMKDAPRALTAEQERDPIGKSVASLQNDLDSRSWDFDLSSDGQYAAYGRSDGDVKLYATGKGQLLRSIATGHKPFGVVAFSPDNRLVMSGGGDMHVKLWDVHTGELKKTLEGHTWMVRSAVFLPDGTRLLTGGGDRKLIIWDFVQGRALRTIENAHEGPVLALNTSADGRLAVSGGSDFKVKLWDLETGRSRHTLAGHTGEVNAVLITPDGGRVVSGSADGTMRVWSARTGALLGTFVTAANGEWLLMTPEGFFASSPGGGAILSVLRGREVITIDQVHQSLFNPDLVRESLQEDPRGEVREAGKVINLDKVLDSGPAPLVAITASGAAGPPAPDVYSVTARIEDRGKGVGRVEWRVNGITSAVSAVPKGAGPVATLTQKLALDPADNVIEVVAYNASNILASKPARMTVKVAAKAARTKPKLHILAIGINAYEDKGAKNAKGQLLAFGPLNLAVKDAQTFATEMRRAGTGSLYSEVRVEMALDQQATRDNLDKLIERFAQGIDQRDTFILFAAAHGYSSGRHFYLIPQDHQGGIDPEMLTAHAIGQDRLQDWLANRIKARKAVVMLDTCESGALISGHQVSRTDDTAADTSVGRLHEATGRPVLTAAARGQFAHEGVVAGSGQTHGIFTWAVLDALHKGDRDGDGTIELLELVAHVQTQVPALAAKLGGTGRSAVAAAPVFGEQTARFGSRGEDFVLGKRLP